MRVIAKAVAVLEKGLGRIEKKLEGTKALMAERDQIRNTIGQLKPMIKDLPEPKPRQKRGPAAGAKSGGRQ